MIRLGLLDSRRNTSDARACTCWSLASPTRAPCHVVAEREGGRTLNGDLVVVVDPAQVVEPQVPGEGGGLLGDTFHHASVAAQRIDVVVEQLETGTVEGFRLPLAGHCHADARRQARPQRA